MWETLYFAAMLRLPRDFSVEQKKERVAKVISALGLNRCKDTIIGTSSSDIIRTSAGWAVIAILAVQMTAATLHQFVSCHVMLSHVV